MLIANHGGAEIKGTENWGKATEYLMQYFEDPQYLTVDGKPLVVIFHPADVDNEALDRMQEVSKKLGLPGLAIAGCDNKPDQNFTFKTHYNIGLGKFAGAEEHDMLI